MLNFNSCCRACKSARSTSSKFLKNSLYLELKLHVGQLVKLLLVLAGTVNLGFGIHEHNFILPKTYACFEMGPPLLSGVVPTHVHTPYSTPLTHSSGAVALTFMLRSVSRKSRHLLICRNYCQH